MSLFQVSLLNQKHFEYPGLLNHDVGSWPRTHIAGGRRSVMNQEFLIKEIVNQLANITLKREKEETGRSKFKDGINPGKGGKPEMKAWIKQKENQDISSGTS